MSPAGNIAGFTCPDGDTLSPHGQALAHPSFAHPASCQKFIACYFKTDIRELGCMKGQVFNHENGKCATPEDGPDDWYVLCTYNRALRITYSTYYIV
ncbi:MAG TPA: hypothetical protein EYQ00_10360 [Dehalococcoidia bacterium]|nr:hypothetical protein [Dehalococcoidia bacterium]